MHNVNNKKNNSADVICLSHHKNKKKSPQHHSMKTQRNGYKQTQYQLNTEELKQNHLLEKLNAIERIEWALNNISGPHILSSSFGIQSAAMLHMVTKIVPNIPVVLTDTQHLFPETYQFIEHLTEQLNLNLHVYKAHQSADSQFKQYGALWEQGREGLEKYHLINKIEPFERAMKTLNAQCWFSGVRRHQSPFRQNLPVISTLRHHMKVHPIIDWTNKDIHAYLSRYNLPYHPLFEAGYSTIGDTHSSRPQLDLEDESDTRFNGSQRECGLHSVNIIQK